MNRNGSKSPKTTTTMATINICDRTKETSSIRRRINEIDLSASVINLKSKVSQVIEKRNEEFDLVYCGQCLKDDSSLESYGLHSGSTLHALTRHQEAVLKEKDKIANSEIKSVISILQTAIQNPAYKSVVENIINSPEMLHDIVNAVPGLDQYPTTLSLFQDHELLSVLAHPGNIRRVIESYPCFPEVARQFANAVKEAGSKGEYTRSSTASYSLDHMSDDDEPGPASAQPITANQLAAALAAASGQPVFPQAAASSSSGQNQPIGPAMITQDFFQQAIVQAQNAAIGGQIAQMREMGITDENVARQALAATNGDLQAALDLIFSGALS